MDKNTYGRYVAWARQENNMTQEQLAQKLQCATSTISRIEKGEEIPKRTIFLELNKAFEGLGLEYGELTLNNILDFDKAKSELLDAIKKGRADEIERKLDKFEKYMDEDDVDDKQLFVFAHLICSRKNGSSIEEFLDEAIDVFELRRKIPDFDDIPKIKLSKIEYELLSKIGQAHMLAGDTEVAERIFKGLMNNKIDERSPFIKERYMSISFILAKLYLMKKDFDTSHNCLGYVFNEFIENCDTRTLYQSLFLQSQICEQIGDAEGAKLIDLFIDATEKLMTYMAKQYKLGRKQ